MNAWKIRIVLNYFIYLILAFFPVACDSSLCSNQILDEMTSPDGKYIASFFERDCGATTPYVRVVSLRLSKEKLKPENFNDWVFTIHGQPEVKISWKNSKMLNISFSGTGDKPTQRNKWQEIEVSFQNE